MNQGIATTTISGLTECSETLGTSLSSLIGQNILELIPQSGSGNEYGYFVQVTEAGAESLQAVIEGTLLNCGHALTAVSRVDNVTAFYLPISAIIVLLTIHLMFNIFQWKNPHKDNAK